MLTTQELNNDLKRAEHFFSFERKLAEEKARLIMLLPLELREYINQHSYFAGGCIYSLYNGLVPKDYDLFLDSVEAVEKMKAASIDSITFKSEYAITLGQYQIVTRFVGTPDDVIGEFDFMHNMFYFHGGRIHNVAPWRYLNSKKLIFNRERARDVCGALMRVPKFISRGMTISKFEMAWMLDKLDQGHFDPRERYIIEKFKRPRNRSASTY